MKSIISIALLFFFFQTFSQTRVCTIKKSTNTSGIRDRYTLYSTSGNPILDQQTLNELSFLSKSFLVRPNFFFYDDNDGKNSKATDEVTVWNCPDGTIIFGKRLFNSTVIKYNGITVIPVMMAHEFAHIVDFKYGALSHVSSKKKELFADYLAGIFMFVRSRSFAVMFDIDVAAESFEELGDTVFGDTDAHGSPEERKEALLSGYYEANEYFNQGKIYQLTLVQAIREAKNYLKTIEEEDDGATDPNDN